MSAHTPGPWRVSTIGRRNDGSIAVMSSDGPVAYANLLKPTKRGAAHASDDATSESNARLIAAAPDLYAVLKRATERSDRLHAEGCKRLPEMQDIYDAAVAAIAKAEGREP